MNKIAQFKKVSLKQWTLDTQNNILLTSYTKDKKKDIYNLIELPTRATKGSAGYDFKLPIDIFLAPGKTIKIPTGIRVEISEDWVFQIYPRSSLGFKYKLQLDNSVGIIDSDYYHSDNEGHIWIKMTNNGEKVIDLAAGDAFAQGIFIQYGVTYDDNVSEIRNGGIGSTNK